MVELKFHSAEEPIRCTQCGKEREALVELILDTERADTGNGEDKESLFYCPACWELVGHKMAERFTRWLMK